jgi:hypothetical protein
LRFCVAYCHVWCSIGGNTEQGRGGLVARHVPAGPCACWQVCLRSSSGVLAALWVGTWPRFGVRLFFVTLVTSNRMRYLGPDLLST